LLARLLRATPSSQWPIALVCRIVPLHRLGAFFYGDAANNITAPCNTDAKTCGTGCTAPMGGDIQNFKTCSTCTNTACAPLTSNETCLASPGCYWVPSSCASNKPTPVRCGGQTSSACTAEDNCYWLSYSRTACDGAAKTISQCYSCNNTDLTKHAVEYRSAYNSLKNKKCTWSASSGSSSSSDFSLKFLAVDQNANCAKLTTSMMGVVDIADRTKLGDAAFANTFGANVISSSTTPTCTDPPSSAMLVAPSLFVMGLVAVFFA